MLKATSPTAPAPGSFWKYGAGLFLAVVLFSLPQTALIPLLDRDEPRFAEASREMLQSGDFIVPTFNREPRYNKPPLIYWCQVISYTIFGENSFSARLPSVLATAGTAVILFVWSVELGSECIGMIAGLAYPLCLQTMQQGRVATADGLLIFFMTLTGFAGWKIVTMEQDRRGIFWNAVLVLGFAGGFLAKGPEALLPLLPMLICARGNRARLVVDFLLGLAIVLLWAIPAYLESHGDYVKVGMREGLWDRMITSLQGHGASTLVWYLLGLLFFYPLWFLFSALPLWPLLVTHRKKLFGGWKLDRLDGYLLLNVALIILVFSLMVTKLPHYTLPAFPILALLFARRWIAAGLHPQLPTQLSGGIGLIFAVLTFVLVPVALAHDLTPSPVGVLVREARDTLTPDTEFALVDFQEPNAIWEMRRVTKGYGRGIEEEEVISFLAQPGPHAVILKTSTWQKLQAQADPACKVFEARGWNTAKGWDSKQGTLATIDLTLVVKR